MLRLTDFIVLVFVVHSRAIINNPSAYIAKPGCSSSLRSKEAFQLQNLTGVWYEIQRYPTQFEKGKCNVVNFDTIKRPNDTLVIIVFSETVKSKEKEFAQNATLQQLNSVWDFGYNASLIGKFKKCAKIVSVYELFISHSGRNFIRVGHKLP